YLTQQVASTLLSIHFAMAVMVVMSSRVYLNLVWAVHGQGRDDDYTTHLTSSGIEFDQQRSTPVDGRDQTGTNGTKTGIENYVTLTTFTTVSRFIPSLHIIN
ncbi:hypothetical protein FRC17_002502, partial [Serendipita sp. 399]